MKNNLLMSTQILGDPTLLIVPHMQVGVPQIIFHALTK